MDRYFAGQTNFSLAIRDDMLLFPAKVQVQQIEAPENFNASCTADIVKAWNAGGVALVPAGRGTLGDTIRAPHGALLRELFRRSLQQYVQTFYKPEIHDQFEFHLELFPMVRDDGKPIATHCHAESFVVMVYYPDAVDCSRQANISGGGPQYFENQLVLCPTIGPRLEEKFSRQKNTNVALSPERGLMIITPGYLPHFVTPAERKQSRVSIIGVVSTTPRTALPIDLRAAEGELSAQEKG